MHWLKTLVLFAALLCGSDPFSTTICPSVQIYKDAKTTYFPFSPVNQQSSPAILYGNSAPNCLITNQNLEVSTANAHNQQSRNNKYRLGRKRWKNGAFRSFTPLPASGIRNFLSHTSSIEKSLLILTNPTQRISLMHLLFIFRDYPMSSSPSNKVLIAL